MIVLFLSAAGVAVTFGSLVFMVFAWIYPREIKP